MLVSKLAPFKINGLEVPNVTDTAERAQWPQT